MKMIDVTKIDSMFFGDLDKKISVEQAKLDKLTAELSSLKSKLKDEEAKLANVKDNIDSYKRQFHTVSEIKVDILAVESLISHTREDIQLLEEKAPEYWKKGIAEYEKIVKPFTEQYAAKKAELFEILIQMIRLRAAVNDLGSSFAGRYHLDVNSLISKGLTNTGMMYAPENKCLKDASCFFDNFLKLANGDNAKARELQIYGELRK